MTDVQLSARIVLHAEDYPTTGPVEISAATQTSRMQQAIARMTVDPDDYLTADVNVYYLPAGGTGDGDMAWGKSYSGRKIHVAPGDRDSNPAGPGTSSYQQQATILHEIAHKVDNDILNPTDRANIMALMVPVPPGSGGAQSRWSGGAYKARPSEIFAYAFVEAYSDIQNILPGYYDREIPNSNFAAFRAIADAAGTPSDPPPEPDPIEPPPLPEIPSGSGNSISVTVTPRDDDANDKMTGAILEVYPGGTTQAQINAGLVPTKTDQKLWTTSPYPTSTTLTGAGLSVGSYIIRVRTRDRGNNVADQSKWEWGNWTDKQTVTVRFTPGMIGGLEASTDTLVPVITGQLVHQDAAAKIERVRLIVTYKNPANGAVTTMLDEWFEGSGITGGTAFTKTYTGAPLSPAREYELNGQIEDDQGDEDTPGQIGPLLTTPVKFTLTEASGPVDMTPRTLSPKQNTRSPTLTIGNSALFDAYELEVANEASGQGGLAWDQPLTAVTATTSLAVPWGGAAPLPWGGRPSWRAKITNAASGVAGEWSEWVPFAINSLPETPLFYVQDQDGNWVLLSTLTSKTIPSTSAEFDFAYKDPDRSTFGELPKWREVTVLNDDLTLRAKIVKRLYGYEDRFLLGHLDSFDQPNIADAVTLTTANSGWTAGTATTLAYISGPGPTPVRNRALRATVVALPTATISTQDRGDRLGVSAIGSWTDLSQLSTFSIRVRAAAIPTGLNVTLRVEFNNNFNNFADFTITPTATALWQTKTMTRASPVGTGGTVDWTKVSGYRIRVQHTAGSNQTFTLYWDEFVADVLELDSGYRLSGRYMDQNTENAWGSYSHGGQNAILFVSQPPIVLPVTPVATRPMPLLGWTLSRGDQASYLVEVIDVATGGVIDSSGWVESDDTFYQIPPERLRTGREYKVTVSVLSVYGVIGTATTTSWTTNFIQLPALTGFELTPDSTHSTVHAAFAADGISEEDFYAFRLFVTYTGVERLLVAEWYDKTQLEVTDWSPPTGVELFYELTQYDGWLDSNPVSATTTVGQAQWWLVVPDDITLAFPIYVEGSFTRSEAARLNAKQPMGRATPIAVTDTTSAPTGSFSVHVPAEDFEAVEQVRAVARASRTIPFVYLKTRFGESLRVKLGTANETYLHAGAIGMSYTTVVWQPPVRGLTTPEEAAVQPIVIEAVDWIADQA